MNDSLEKILGCVRYEDLFEGENYKPNIRIQKVGIDRTELYKKSLDELAFFIRVAAKDEKIMYVIFDSYTLAKYGKITIVIYVEKGGIEV